jgi:hypothetical protein
MRGDVYRPFNAACPCILTVRALHIWTPDYARLGPQVTWIWAVAARTIARMRSLHAVCVGSLLGVERPPPTALKTVDDKYASWVRNCKSLGACSRGSGQACSACIQVYSYT